MDSRVDYLWLHIVGSSLLPFGVAHGVTEDINHNTITTLQIKLFIVKSKIYKITLEIKVPLLQVRIDK